MKIRSDGVDTPEPIPKTGNRKDDVCEKRLAQKAKAFTHQELLKAQ
ncbi:MAG: hypothetical protein ACTSXQ_07715 [Alphaproteobacteria bacterium]